MAQDLTFENQPNGQGAIRFGDHSFQVSQRMILLGNQSLLQRVGLIEKQIAGFPPVIINGANRINAILNTKSADSGIEAAQSINAFWFDSGGQKPDFIFLRIPIHTGQTISNALVMLYAEKGSGPRFIEALKDDSINQAQLQNLLSQILQINNAQQIDSSQIITENLVIFPQSTLELGNGSTKQGANMNLLYQQNKDKIIIRNISTKRAAKPSTLPPLDDVGPDDIDLSEFVKQSVFFRDDPRVNPQATKVETIEEVKESTETTKPITEAKKSEFNPHPKVIEVNGQKITLQGLGMVAKGMTDGKVAMLGVTQKGLERDYSRHNVFNVENARDLSEMLDVIVQGVNVVKGKNPFSTNLDEKLLLVKASDHDTPFLMISVPDRGSRSMYGEDLDRRLFRMFRLFLKADKSDLDYIANSILHAPSAETVKTILDSIVHADINKAFGIPYNLDDRMAVLEQTEEVLTIGRQKTGKYYNTSYFTDKKRITDILTQSLIEAPPGTTK